MIYWGDSMIKNQWYAILDSKEVPKGKIISVTRIGEKLVLWRESNGTVNCIYDKCCHRGASLGKGVIHNDHIACPFHGFEYDGSGKVKCIPANGKNAPVPDRYRVNSYLVKEKYDFIWIWFGDKKEGIPKINFFEDLKEGFYYSTFKDSWGVHYTRCIENQLDVVHLPFVHRTTIGKGDNTLVNGPVVVREGNLLKFYVNNIKDDGKTTPLKSKEIKDYEKLFQLQFLYPNIWQNIIGDKVRVFAAFSPVDEENSVVYIRFYHKIVKVPVIREIISFFGKISSIVILRQDKRVVKYQLPKKSNYKMDEKLIGGDLPIIEYRKHREELQNEK